jgi:UTP-glucose-1-phosphate uridylyltransferase
MVLGKNVNQYLDWMQRSKSLKTLVVLAGGMASRYGGKKQIDPVGPNNECLLEYALYDAINFGFNKFVFVINQYFDETIKSYFYSILKAKQVEVHFVLQSLASNLPSAFHTLLNTRVKPWGTGHAVLVVKGIVHEPFVVMNADDYYGPIVFQKTAQAFEQKAIHAEAMQVLAFPVTATLSDHGAVSRGVCELDADKNLLSITERTKIIRTENGIAYIQDELVFLIAPDTLVSMNCWVLDPIIFEHLEVLFSAFLNANQGDITAEFYLPVAINALIQKQLIHVKVETTTDEWFGITYSEDKQHVVNQLRNKIKLGIYPVALWE